MEAFPTSALVVALDEIGDKTQLLSLLLAARYKKPLPIIAGILIATQANHFSAVRAAAALLFVALGVAALFGIGA